jgi:hypothetical protein
LDAWDCNNKRNGVISPDLDEKSGVMEAVVLSPVGYYIIPLGYNRSICDITGDSIVESR